MIDEPMLKRAKRQMEVQFRMGMDSIEGNMMYLGTRVDEEKLSTQQEWIDAIRMVQRHDVQAWARKYLSSNSMWTVAGSENALASAQTVL